MGIYKAVRDGFKKAKTRFLFGSIFNILSSFILIYLVVLIGDIVDLLKDANFSPGIIYKKAIFAIILGIINFFSFMIFSYVSYGSGAKLKMYYKDIIFRKILRKSPDFFQKNTAGDVIGLADNETRFIYDYFTFGILMMSDSIVMPTICSFYLIFFISWKLTIAIMIPFAFTILTKSAVHPIPVPGARRSCMDSSLKIVVAYGLSHTSLIWMDTILSAGIPSSTESSIGWFALTQCQVSSISLAFSQSAAFTTAHPFFTSGIPLYGIGSTPIIYFPALRHSSRSFCAVYSTE